MTKHKKKLTQKTCYLLGVRRGFNCLLQGIFPIGKALNDRIRSIS